MLVVSAEEALTIAISLPEAEKPMPRVSAVPVKPEILIKFLLDKFLSVVSMVFYF
jgi:hypothetical protein